MDWDPIHKELVEFIRVLFFYLTHRLHRGGLNFEKFKNIIVDVLMVRRGANTSMFVHASVISLAIVVFVGGGVLSSTSVVSGSYPGVAANPLEAAPSAVGSEIAVVEAQIAPVTLISDKPRDKVIDYEVKEGDTVSSVAQEYAVSEETILWENNLTEKSKIKPGDTLRVLPVSGVAHKVKQGDTVYSVAKTYRANSQAILDFPFNNVASDFALSTGDLVIIPDGAPPEKAKPAPTQYLAKGQEKFGIADLGSSLFGWPAVGQISQYYSWYHPALDISNLGGGPIRASDGGTVTIAGWPDNSGYGNRVLVDHGNGYTTLYAHMSAVYVSPGQRVAKGEVVGMMGSTGRSTGTHLHIEIRKNGSTLNPLGALGK